LFLRNSSTIILDYKKSNSLSYLSRWVLVGRIGHNYVSWCTCLWLIVQTISQSTWTHLWDCQL
jgi:hypothetical protein